MQAYGRAFARVYNQRWIHFAQGVAPRICEFYERTPIGHEHRSLLDLCCGTGQLAVHFLERGYRVTGIDLSEHMLAYAQENTAPYVERGQAQFIQADAAQFSLDQRFGLVVSTFDALNHLPSSDALKSCFESVYPLLLPGGTFIFDLNTRAGLLAQWTGISVQDTEEATIITRGVYEGERDRFWAQISGFVRREDGLYERFVQTAYNTAFDLDWVRDALLNAGWQHVHYARSEDLSAPLADPECETRVFAVVSK